MEDSMAQFSAKQEIVSVLIYSQKMAIANAVAPFMVGVQNMGSIQIQG
jgi:hypothetical protein